jgi:glycosyltransferase involved in cell wall biosynthesis
MERDRSGAVPAVSVLIPTYQRRRFVARAVRSVLAQTFQDFELIVVDDGSTDGTEEALRGLDPRLRYKWQPNGGAAAARNAGIRLARGEIIAFLDSDDRWLRNHLAVVTGMLARYPEAVLACTCPRFRIAGHQKVEEARLVDGLPLQFAENAVGYHSCVAARREALLAVGGFDERLIVMEGRELFLRLAARGPFSLLQRRTIVYQNTRGSLVDRASLRGDYLDALELAAKSAAEIVEGLRRGDRRELAARAEGTRRYAAALRALVHGDDGTLREELREACRLLPELSSEPWSVFKRIAYLSYERPERLRRLAAAAAAWPDPHAETALYLRVAACATALRAGRLREAFALATGFPLRSGPRFALRVGPVLAHEVRRGLQGLRHRGKETPELAASPAPGSDRKPG